MRRLISLACLAAAPTLGAQQLAERVAAVRNGTATFSYASRPDVCGVGDVLMLQWLERGSQAFVFSPEWGMASGSWDTRGQPCRHGPARVQVGVRDGQVTTLQPSVGASGGGRGRDLGVMATRDVVDFLLALARRAPEDVAGRALLAAALADSVAISSRLVALAEDRGLPAGNREQALKWIGWTARREGNTSADAHVRSIAADETDDADVRERAIRVVELPAGEAFLKDLYRRLTRPDLKERVIRVVGETGGAEAMAWLKSIAVDGAEPLDARERALRTLGEQKESTYLREVYPRLGHVELQDRVLRALGEAGGVENVRFLRRVALDANAASDLRDRAVRLLSEVGVPTAELVQLYDSIQDADVRDRLIRLLAERGDRDARVKLADIAANDPDADLRRRAQRERQ
jgi:hypothetical protein